MKAAAHANGGPSIDLKALLVEARAHVRRPGQRNDKVTRMCWGILTQQVWIETLERKVQQLDAKMLELARRLDALEEKR